MNHERHERHEKKSKGLVPKLRFQEFRGENGWEAKEFSKYIVLYRGSSPRPIKEYLTNEKNGVNWIKIGDTKSAENFIISHVEEKITPKGAEKSRKVNIGELILANSMSFGKTYQLAIDGFIYDGWFVLREYEKYFHKQFLLQLLNSDYMQNQYLKFSAGGIVQNISSDIVYNTILPHTTFSEQQKIADCLSSLDELITAEAQKLDALKAHKKGLMQKLFPAEGENVPEWRFPEFRDKEEWEVKKLGKTFKFKQGVQVPIEEQFNNKRSGMVRFIRIIDLTQEREPCRFINDPGDEHIVKCNELFMIRYGTPGIVAFGYEGVIANNLFRLIWKDESNFNPIFWFYIFKNIEKTIFNLSCSSSMPAISFSLLNNISVLIPKLLNEQQKIADCLSSLDELITAQSQKIAALKAHKKGLMQQIFPTTEEVQE